MSRVKTSVVVVPFPDNDSPIELHVTNYIVRVWNRIEQRYISWGKDNVVTFGLDDVKRAVSIIDRERGA